MLNHTYFIIILCLLLISIFWSHCCFIPSTAWTNKENVFLFLQPTTINLFPLFKFLTLATYFHSSLAPYCLHYLESSLWMLWHIFWMWLFIVVFHEWYSVTLCCVLFPIGRWQTVSSWSSMLGKIDYYKMTIILFVGQSYQS